MSTGNLTLFPLLGASQHSHLADLEAVVASIQAQITDLERDYAPRDRAFWEASLDLLHDLRQALQPFLLFYEEQGDSASSLGFPLHVLHLQLHKTEAAMFAYLPRCRSSAKRRLQQRHDLLKCFRMIRDTTRQFITTVERLVHERQGGHEEQVPSMPAPSPSRLARRGPGSLADLEAPVAQISTMLADLERDPALRPQAFWQAIIDLLFKLRRVIQPFFHFLKEHCAIAHPLITPLYLLDACIDTVLITLTAYLPRCQSKAKNYRRRYDDLLTRLRTLNETALALVAAVTIVEKQLTEAAQAKQPSWQIVGENELQSEEDQQ